jgi:hypothetical protein
MWREASPQTLALLELVSFGSATLTSASPQAF